MDSALMWFRRDLRLHDNAALYHCLKSARRVVAAFVFDRAILDELLAEGLTTDRRVDFIHRSLRELDDGLRAHGGALLVRHGIAADEIVQLAEQLGVDAVFANRDYEPYAAERDAQVAARLATTGRALHTFKDQVVFERDEVLTGAGRPFSVFTPYKNAWLKALTPFQLRSYDTGRYTAVLYAPPAPAPLPALEDIGFARSDLDELKVAAGASGGQALFDEFKARIDRYGEARDYPAVRGPSYLSVHLRFGTVSIRELARVAHQRAGQSAGAATWLSELIWRDFYQQILHHHPQVTTRSFKPEYDRIRWDDAPELFAAWCEGRTGYPLVDAAMAQINRTGYMHNRLRMVSASFLTKDLGIDWRHGERYFARRLIDYDLAANNGGWQWAASSGCDAQPYFRIFNPVAQSEKFDPDGKFIRRYLPALANLSPREIHAPWLLSQPRQQETGCVIGIDYPSPIVEHAAARAKTLARYAVVKPR
jgi:deoxyribodipyrimidine photo-lyase